MVKSDPTHTAPAPEKWVLLEKVYEPAFYEVSVFVSRHGGTLNDAKDVFHDAFIIFYNQYNHEQHIHSEVHYVTGIARHLWYKRIRKNMRNFDIDDSGLSGIHIPEEPTVNQHKLLSFLEKAGKRCLDLLVSFYIEGNPVNKIANDLGFAGDHAVSVRKYKCMEKIRESIKTKKMTYEDFFE